MLTNIVEGAVDDLGIVVATGTVQVYIRDTYLQRHLLTFLCGEFGEETDMRTLALIGITDDSRLCYPLLILFTGNILQLAGLIGTDVSLPETIVLHGLTEHSMVIDGVTGVAFTIAPAATFGQTFQPAFQRAVVHHFNIFARGSTSHTTGQVYLDARLLVFGEGEAQGSATCCGTGLHLDIVVGQQNAVVASLGRLALLVEVRPPAFKAPVLPASDGVHLSRGRHHGNIAHVTIPAYTAHLCHRESLDGLVFTAVARAVVAASDSLRADLHHAEGCGGTREGLAQSVVSAGHFNIGAGSYEGVHQVGRCLSGCVRLTCCQQHRKTKDCCVRFHILYFHFSNLISKFIMPKGLIVSLTVPSLPTSCCRST